MFDLFNLPKIYAAGTNPVEDIVGKITNPLPDSYKSLAQGGLILFISNILRLMFVVAGIYALFNFIMAGYQYMAAAGDQKALSDAWNRIWQSLVGLVLIVISFALAALFGFIFFHDASFILSPKIYGPGN